MDLHGLWMLNTDGTPRPAETIEEWADSLRDVTARIVEKTNLPFGVEVSTVFLSTDHNYSGTGPPVLWETMVFGGEEEIQERYTSLADAKAGHARIVAEQKAVIARRLLLEGE